MVGLSGRIVAAGVLAFFLLNAGNTLKVWCVSLVCRSLSAMGAGGSTALYITNINLFSLVSF